jgi:hypothetical protein
MTPAMPEAEQSSARDDKRRAGHRTAGLTLVTVTGVLLALAATAPSEPTAAGDVARRFIIDLPDWIVVTIVATFAAATLLLLALIVPRPRRRRRRGEEELPEYYFEPPKLTPGVAVVLLLLALFPFGVVGAMIWFPHNLGQGEVPPTGRTVGPSAMAPNSAPPPPAASQPSAIHSVAASGILGTLAILAAVAALGLVLWLYFGDWLLRVRPSPSRGVRHGLAAAVEDSLDELKLEPDARRAIIKCYARFERVLASIDHPRAPSQTPVEFMRLILAQLQLPEDAVREITRLFELSRFSRHELRDADRSAAWRSLAAIKAALDRKDANASTS